MGVVYFDKHKAQKMDQPTNVGHSVKKSLQIYCDFFERLSPDEFELYQGLYHYRVRYSNPVDDVNGVERIQHIFSTIISRCDAPRLDVLDTAVSGQHAMGYWRFSPNKKSTNAIVGMSRIKFDGYGRVISHRDVWDRSQASYASKLRWWHRLLGLAGKKPKRASKPVKFHKPPS